MKKEKKVRVFTPPLLPSRKPEAHKGDFGRILIVAGSRGMAGAAVLAGEAAYRSGAGLVDLCVPDRIADIVSAKTTCAIVRPQEDTPGGALAVSASARILEFAKSCDASAIGPGLGTDFDTAGAVRRLVKELAIPVVLDADGLNAFAGSADHLREHLGTLILTPHPGELARLLEIPVDRLQADRSRQAKEAAARFRATVVLKGDGTVVTDGKRVYVNRTGNPGMATGGSGDVLTGVIAALVGQGLSAFDAAVLGAHLHGMAGDLAAEKFGQVSMMATDLLDWLPHAFEKHRARRMLEE